MNDEKKPRLKLTVKPESLKKQVICDGLYTGDCTGDLKPMLTFSESDLNEFFEDTNDEKPA